MTHNEMITEAKKWLNAQNIETRLFKGEENEIKNETIWHWNRLLTVLKHKLEETEPQWGFDSYGYTNMRSDTLNEKLRKLERFYDQTVKAWPLERIKKRIERLASLEEAA